MVRDAPKLEENYSPPAIDRLKKEGTAFNRWRTSNLRSLANAEGGIVATSFSGHERNHIFFNSPEAKFEDLSGISGLDSIQDSRVFSLLDFDRDGWLDLAVVNANYPLLNVYRNRLGELHARNRIARNVIAVRLVGGNHTPKPNSRYTSRDGYGAVVNLRAGDLSLMREHRCGDGMGAQNSNTILIGIGENLEAENLTVTWPSGDVQTIRNVKAGTLITVYENPEQSPTKKDATFENYLKNITAKNNTVENVTAAVKPVSSKQLDFAEIRNLSSTAKMRIFTSTSTLCAACKKKIPQLRAIRSYFSKGEIAMLGVPVEQGDLKNQSEKLIRYREENHPPYEIMLNLSESARIEFVVLKKDLVGFDVEPSTIVTDAKGTIFYAEAGVPDISTLKKILQHIESRQ